MVARLLAAAQLHPVRSTAAVVGLSLLLLSSLWSGRGGSETARVALSQQEGGGAGAEALRGARPTQAEAAEQRPPAGHVRTGVCIDEEPEVLPEHPPGSNVTTTACIAWARDAFCAKLPSFMLRSCPLECEECEARPVCCAGVHAAPTECEGVLGWLQWARPFVHFNERWTLFPGVRSIVEIGGNMGLDVGEFVRRFPEAQVFAYEPVPEFFEVLESQMRSFPLVTVSNFGVSDSNYTAMFTVDGQSTSDLSLKGRKQVHAVVRDVDWVLSELQRTIGGVPDVVSLNCEGCEYAVLRRMAERGWIGRVPFLQLSWHVLVDNANRSTLRCDLERHLRQSYDPIFYSEYFGWQAWQLHGQSATMQVGTSSGAQGGG